MPYNLTFALINSQHSKIISTLADRRFPTVFCFNLDLFHAQIFFVFYLRALSETQNEVFEAIVKADIVSKVRGPGVRPRFYPLLMFKVRVLLRLHGPAEDDTSLFQSFIHTGSMDHLLDALLAHLQKAPASLWPSKASWSIRALPKCRSNHREESA